MRDFLYAFMSRLSCKLRILGGVDPSTYWLYLPRSVLGWSLFILISSYAVGIFGRPLPTTLISLFPVHPSWSHPGFRGSVAAACGIVSYGALMGPESPFIRPHPMFWRATFGVALAYCTALLYLLFQTPADARALVAMMDPARLGRPLEHRDYATDCRLITPEGPSRFSNIKAVLLDEFALAHTLGWWGKALALRDPWLLWVGSIGFELLEMTLRPWFPNFNECWWDTWLVDVLGCNVLGMVLGLETCRYLRQRRYDWQGLSRLSSVKARVKRSLEQLTPYRFDPYRWRPFSSPGRLLRALVPVGVILVAEVHAFSLKSLLWIKPRHPFVTLRLTLWFLLALPAVHEYYEYALARETEDPCMNRFRKMGVYAWMALALAMTETAVVFSLARADPQFAAPLGAALWWWAGGAVVAGMLLGLWQWHLRPAPQPGSRSCAEPAAEMAEPAVVAATST